LNYLAHIFLSGSKPKVKVGNFIGDFVKGSRLNNYPTDIKNGIVLHRKIDEFTDSHEIVRNMIGFLRPQFGRYSGIIIDMYFDYFLALNFKKYSNMSLTFFSIKFYISVLWNYKYLPKRVKGFIFHFISTNRLKKYGSLAGLESSLRIMESYKIPSLNPELIIDFLKKHHEFLENEFLIFMPDLIHFCNKNK